MQSVSSLDADFGRSKYSIKPFRWFQKENKQMYERKEEKDKNMDSAKVNAMGELCVI